MMQKEGQKFKNSKAFFFLEGRFWALIFFLVCAFGLNEKSFATQSLMRCYNNIESTRIFSLTKLEFDSSAQPKLKTCQLKDPLLGRTGFLDEIKQKNETARQKFEFKSKTAFLRFRPLNVTGRKANPRVRFDQPRLSVGMTEDQEPKDFLNKVFESADTL